MSLLISFSSKIVMGRDLAVRADGKLFSDIHLWADISNDYSNNYK